jgi:hypothetical protein
MAVKLWTVISQQLRWREMLITECYSIASRRACVYRCLMLVRDLQEAGLAGYTNRQPTTRRDRSRTRGRL